MKTKLNRIIAGFSAAAIAASMLSLVSFAEEVTGVPDTVSENQLSPVFGAQVYAMDNRSWQWSSVFGNDPDGDLKFTVSGNANDIVGGTASFTGNDVGAAGVQLFITNANELPIGTTVTCRVDMTLEGEYNRMFLSKTLMADFEVGIADWNSEDHAAGFDDDWMGYGSDWSKFTQLGDFTLELSFSDIEIKFPDEDDDTGINGVYTRQDVEGGCCKDWGIVGEHHLSNPVTNSNIARGQAVKMTVDYELMEECDLHCFAPAGFDSVSDEWYDLGEGDNDGLSGVNRSQYEDGTSEQLDEAAENGGVILTHDGYVLAVENGSVTLYIDEALFEQLLERSATDDNGTDVVLGLNAYGVNITNVTYEYAVTFDYNKAYTESLTVSGEEYPGQWGGMAFSYESLEYIVPHDGMRVTVDYSLTEDAEEYRSIAFVDAHEWLHMNDSEWSGAMVGVDYVGDMDYDEMIASDHPVQLTDGWIYIPKDGQMTFYVTEQGVQYLLQNAKESELGRPWYGIGFQVNGVKIDSATYEWNVSTVTDDETGLIYLPGDDGTASIVGNKKGFDTNNEIVIPKEMDGFKITSVSAGALDGLNTNTLTIDADLGSVYPDMFLGLNAETIKIGDGISSMEGWSISDRNVKNVYISKNVKSLGENAVGYYAKYDEELSKVVWSKNEDLTIFCFTGSAAHRYAIKNKIKYVLPDVKNPTVAYEKGDSSVKLSWGAVSGAEMYGIAGYQNGEWKLLDKTADTSYTLKKLKAGQEYKVAVVSMFDGKWNMDLSNAITVTPKEAAVSLYPEVETQVKDGRIGFKWNKIPGVEKYGIGIYQTNKWKVVKQLDGSITTWTSPQVRSGKYRLVVLAKVNGQWVNADVFKKAFYVTVS